jgi:putative NADPH-quinone reductase
MEFAAWPLQSERVAPRHVRPTRGSSRSRPPARRSAADTLTGEVKAEQAKLLWADALFLQFPLWRFTIPAILKGWVASHEERRYMRHPFRLTWFHR